MRPIILSFLLMFAVAVPTFAQKPVNDRDLPQNILTDFKSREPNAENPKWTQLDSTTYEVNFVANGGKKSIRFTKTTSETRWDVDLKWIPAKIKAYADSAYAKGKAESLCILDFQGNKSYELVLKQKKHQYLLKFGIDGQFIEATEIKKKK